MPSVPLLDRVRPTRNQKNIRSGGVYISLTDSEANDLK